MSFFNKSRAEKELPEDHGNVLFPHHNPMSELPNGSAGAILHDGVITFPAVQSAADQPSQLKKPM